MPSEIAPTPVIRAPTPARSENLSRFGYRPAPRENRPIQPRTHTPLPDRILSARNELALLLDKLQIPNQPEPKSAEKPIKAYRHKIEDPSSSTNHRGLLAKIAGFAGKDRTPPRRHIPRPPHQVETQTIPALQRLHPVQQEQPIRRHTTQQRETKRAERVFQKQPVSIKNVEVLMKQATEKPTLETIPKDEFKTLHPSEHFFKNIPKIKEIPHTNEEVVGSIPGSRIVAERNFATPFEVYIQGDRQKVIRKIHTEAIQMELIKDNGEGQIVKADNGRNTDSTHTLAFQTIESGKKKYYRLEEGADLVMRFIEMNKKEVAKVIAKRQEYARKMGILPKKDSLRDHPGLEIRASQKKRDHFYTWHDMLDKISMKSIQNLGKAHIVCDRSLPPEKASAFSKKFIEAYYSEKYEGLSIEERTKQAYMDTLKELGLEKEPSVATYLVTREDVAYVGGKGSGNVTATYGDQLDETEPPEVFQPEQTVFKSKVLTIGGRELVLDDVAPVPIKSTAPEISPDNSGVGIQLIIHPDEE